MRVRWISGKELTPTDAHGCPKPVHSGAPCTAPTAGTGRAIASVEVSIGNHIDNPKLAPLIAGGRDTYRATGKARTLTKQANIPEKVRERV